MGAVKSPLTLILLPFLAACGDGADAPVDAQRVSLDDARTKVAKPLVSPAYDHETDEAAMRARWIQFYVGDRPQR